MGENRTQAPAVCLVALILASTVVLSGPLQRASTVSPCDPREAARGLDLDVSDLAEAASHADSAQPSFLPDARLGSRASWTEPEARPYWRRNLFKRFAQDQKFLVTSWWPAESRRLGFSVPLAVAVAAASRSTEEQGFDLQWERSFEAWTDANAHGTAVAFTRLGDAESAIVLIGGTYLVSRWVGNERMHRVSSLSAEALMNAAVYSTLLKAVTRRSRPAAGGTGEFFVDQPDGGGSPESFPSGHATGAFAIAAVVSREFRDKPWVPWVANGTAGLIALSRVGLGRHFPSDVLAGAVLGHSIGRMVSHRSGDTEGGPAWTRLEPLVDPENRGVGLSYHHTW